MFRIWGKGILYIECNGGILSRGDFVRGDFVLGRILSGGVLSGGDSVLEPMVLSRLVTIYCDACIPVGKSYRQLILFYFKTIPNQ